MDNLGDITNCHKNYSNMNINNAPESLEVLGIHPPSATKYTREIYEQSELYKTYQSLKRLDGITLDNLHFNIGDTMEGYVKKRVEKK